MNKGIYPTLLSKTKDHVAFVRGIPLVGEVDYEQICRVYHRAAQLAILEIVLDAYREKNKTLFNDLGGKQALEHLLLTKYNWALDQIRQLSLSDVLLLLHNELDLKNIDPADAAYFERVLERYDPIVFADVMDEEWDPQILVQLQQQPR